MTIKSMLRSSSLVGLALWLSLIFTLYLAPTAEKYVKADVLAAVLLVVCLIAFGLRRSGVVETVKPLAPLLALLFYEIALTVVSKTASDTHHIQQSLVGFVPFLLMYVVFRRQPLSRMRKLALAVFIVPGLIHLGYMYLDIFTAVKNGDIRIVQQAAEPVSKSLLDERLGKLRKAISQPSVGLLEGIKEAPRTGRRYASMAMLHLLCGGLLLVALFKQPRARYLAWGLIALSILSLALLDARAAYVSVLIGGLMVAASIGIDRTRNALKPVFQLGFMPALALAGLVAFVGVVGFNAGKSRWFSMQYSFDAAKHDVLQSSQSLNSRPYVDREFWSKPLESLDDEDLEFRLKVDQSAYLRMAWSIVGIQSVIESPLGIGYSPDYFWRLWGVAGDDGKYQRGDSFLVENLISLGVVGIFLYAILWWRVGHCLRWATNERHAASTVLMIVGGIVFVCVGRSLVDVFSEGLWRYFMALLGMFYGLLPHAGGPRTEG